MLKLFKKRALATFGAVFLTAASVGAVPFKVATKQGARVDTVSNWKKFHAVHGKCTVSLPQSPEHLKQMMPFPEQGYNLRYDVYVSPHEKKAVYIMLIAQYPPFINESHAQMSLESFLNGLVNQNHDNELIFADLVNVQGYKGLDFFIDSKGVYFKGRAIMAENNLYLLAMECEQNNYLEVHYNHFIESFEFVK
ncbi:MAG: hypothetical protein AAGE99_04790 [Chlamydiota bacterium]